VQTCPHKNIRFGTRKLYKHIVPDKKTGKAIPLFIVIITGFLTYKLILNITKKATFLAAPHWAGETLNIANPHW